MGGSAGANLAAVVCLAARDQGGPAIGHQALIYPVTDAAETSPSYVANAAKPVLTPGDMVAIRRRYLGPDGDARDPRAAPLLAEDHSGLPPALIQWPSTIRCTRTAPATPTLLNAGVAVRLTGYDGMPHGYLSMPWFCRSAPRALAEVVAEQRTVLHPPLTGGPVISR